MKKAPTKFHTDPDGLGEYDLSKGVRGKYANRTGPRSKVIIHGKPGMRELFPGYYDPTEEDFSKLWNECIFAFDANVLLNIYKYTSETETEFFGILRHLQDRIWMPHQVAHEYQRKRLVVISEQQQAYQQIEEALKCAADKLKNDLRLYDSHAFADVKRIVKAVNATIEREKDNLKLIKAKHPDYKQSDPLLEKLTKLFDGKIGEPYTEEELEEIYRKAERRIKHQEPPGYKDAPRVGDILIWYQLLDYAKMHQKPLIFITDDAKEDWWLKDGAIRPRPELIQEMYYVAGIPFYMYLAEGFLEEAKNFLKLQDEQGTIAQAIEEVKEVRQQDEAVEAANNTRLMLALRNAGLELGNAALENEMRHFASIESRLEVDPRIFVTPELQKRIEQINLQMLSFAESEFQKHSEKIRLLNAEQPFLTGRLSNYGITSQERESPEAPGNENADSD